MKLTKAQLNNRAYSSDSVAWNPQLEGRSRPGLDCPFDVPPAIELQEDGSALCRFYAPNAKQVSVGHVLGEQVELEKSEDGVWSGNLSFPCPGLKVIVWKVDGTEVMNPYAPIAYGYGRPVNYIDVPCPEQDYLMIKDVPHGSVTREYFKSSVTGEYESCLVYTPPQYRTEPEKKFPVLYLQHGGSQNENCWVYEAKINFIMDNLLAEGKAVPCIIVMNNGMVQMKDENGKWYTDTDKLQDLLIEDCIPFIDSTYRTLDNAWDRAYAGLSMGSLQGGKFFMERQDIIASAGLFTGYLYPPNGVLKVHTDYLKALDDPEKFNKATRLFFIAVGRDEVSYNKVLEESLDCEKRGIKHVFEAFPGDHEWHAWRGAAHKFLQLLFR